MTSNLSTESRNPDKKADNVEALVAAADAGLYAAKESGRNKVCACSAVTNFPHNE